MSQTAVYELAVLYRPSLSEEIEKVSHKFKKLLQDEGGQILKEDNWGLRQLAYPIAKQQEAVYVFYDVELPKQVITQLENNFNIAEEILRYQFYRPDLRALEKALASPETQLATGGEARKADGDEVDKNQEGAENESES